MNRNKITFALLMATTLATTNSYAQLKVGSPAGAPNSGSILDASNTAATSTAYKGLYMPQVALTSTTTYGLNIAGAALAVDGMVVYNTATAGTGITAVTPGLYIWNNNAWSKVNTSATGNDINIYAGDGTLAGPRTVTQAGNRLSFVGGAVGINTTTTAGLLSNNGGNAIAADSNGINGESFNWRTNSGIGYTASVYNQSNVNGAGGLAVKVSSNLIGTGAFDVSRDTAQSTAGTSLFSVRANGNVGVGTFEPSTNLDVNGSARVRTLLPGSATDSVVTTDASGNLHKRTILDLINNSGVATNIYNGDGTLTGPRTVTQAGNILSFMGGAVGINTTAAVGLLANNAVNTLDPIGTGVNGLSLNWATNANGYSGSFYNSSTVSGANGLMVKVAGNLATTTALDISQGATQATTGTTLFKVQANGNVGIGTSTPASKLHVVGGVTVADGTQGAGKLFVSDATGLGSWQSPAQTKEVMALGNVTTQSALTGITPGASSILTNFAQLVNSITGATFNATTDVVALPAGTYEISVSYELTAPGTCPPSGDLINSYFIDFPNNSASMRVHANSPSVCGASSIHSALWVTTVTIPVGGQTWTMHIGRGAGGNYSDVVNVATTSRVLIKKIL